MTPKLASKAMGLLLALCFASPSLHAEPYGPARERARQTAEQTQQQLDAAYQQLRRALQARPQTGDEEHDRATLEALVQSQQAWQSYRNEQCGLQAQLEVYPQTGRLYTQVYHHCEAHLGQQRLDYLQGVLAELRGE